MRATIWLQERACQQTTFFLPSQIAQPTTTSDMDNDYGGDVDGANFQYFGGVEG